MNATLATLPSYLADVALCLVEHFIMRFSHEAEWSGNPAPLSLTVALLHLVLAAAARERLVPEAPGS